MTETENYTSYPFEIADVVRNQTFYVQAAFSAADIKKGEEPLKIYSHFSRLLATIINTDKKTATSNIPIRDIEDIFFRSDFIISKDMMRSMETAQEKEKKSIAYTVTISHGRFKGKTPAAVLLENGENINVLHSHYNWLKDNLSSYPKNQPQIDAIKEAVDLYRAGKLNAEAVKETAVFSIYSPGFRPLMSRPKVNNKNFVYEISIKYYLGEAYPVVITIENYYAPVIQTEKKLLNVKVKEKENSLKNEMALSVSEWLNIIRSIKTNMRIFENNNAAACINNAIRIDKKNRDEWEQKKSGGK